MTLILNTIKALRNFARMTAANLVTFARSIYEGMNGNPAFPQPPVDMPTLKASIDALSNATADALDGGKLAIATRDSAAKATITILSRLANYVEATSPDGATFGTSGFQAAKSTRTQSPPISEKIRKIVQGIRSGEVFVSLVNNPDAYSYQLRYAPDAGGGIPDGDWTVVPVSRIRPPRLITGLKPVTPYLFQVRAVIKAGYDDWSDSVTFICL